MLGATSLTISSITVLEIRIVLQCRHGDDAVDEFNEMLKDAGIVVVPFDTEMADTAFQGISAISEGTGPPGLTEYQQVSGRTRDLAMFNLAIDSKLRGCDVVSLKVEDIAPHGHAVERATIRQKKTGQPVRFEMTEQTREAVDSYITAANKKRGEVLFGAAEVRICL